MKHAKKISKKAVKKFHEANEKNLKVQPFGGRGSKVSVAMGKKQY